MIITDASLGLPNAEAVGESIRHFYSALVNADYDVAVRFALPDDPDFPDNPEPGFWYVEAEVLELRRMLLFLSSSRNLATGRQDYADAMRAMLLEYLLIVEADFPAFALLNALRFHRQEKPAPRFLNTSGTTCCHPGGRFREICRQAQAITDSDQEESEPQEHAGRLLRTFTEHAEGHSHGMFSDLLRNAIAHSHFRVENRTKESVLLHLTRDYSFITRTAQRNDITGAQGMCTTYTYAALRALHAIATTYWEQADQFFRTFENKLRNPDFRTIKWRLFQARA